MLSSVEPPTHRTEPATGICIRKLFSRLRFNQEHQRGMTRRLVPYSNLPRVQDPLPNSFEYPRSSQAISLTLSGLASNISRAETGDTSRAIVSGFCRQMEPIGGIVLAPVNQRVSFPIQPRRLRSRLSAEVATYRRGPSVSRPCGRTECMGTNLASLPQFYLFAPASY
jgi:hypothetical protein